MVICRSGGDDNDENEFGECDLVSITDKHVHYKYQYCVFPIEFHFGCSNLTG